MPVKERYRTTLACARCYQMKKKCDKRTPSCSRCVQARQPCIGINRQKDVEVPRSIVQYLEQVFNKLPLPTSAAGPSTGLDAHNFQLVLPQSSTSGFQDHYLFLTQKLRRAVEIACTTLLLHSQLGLYHRNRLFYGSEAPPLKIHIGIHQETPYRIRGSFSASKPPNPKPLLVPFEVAKLLLNVYIKNILPRYPCYLESELKQHFDAVYLEQDSEQECGPLLEMSRFIVVMVLAISSLTSKAHDFRKVASLSESLHRDALRHSQFLRRSNTSTLRCFLLLIQFALLLPHTSNLWYMTGEAMRMAIALGLHQEPVEPLEIELVDLRRRTFWTTYILERTVCLTSGCPIAISDEHIKVALPSEYEDSYIAPDGLIFDQTHQRKRTQFLNLIRFRRLQTEIHTVQFFSHRLPESVMDYDKWVEATDREIQNWQDHALSSHKVAPDWFTNAVCATRLMLHRPCLRNATPSDPSILEVVKTAISMVNNSWKLTQTGYLIFPFHNVYNGFHAGIVLLYAIKYRAEIYHSSHLYGQVLDSLSLLTRVFSALAERWPAAANTGYYFNELKEGVLRNIELLPEPDNSIGDVNLIAELDHLITERQTSGIYHRSTAPANNHVADDTSSPDWMRMQLFPLGTDETWEDFMNMGFGFENFDALYIPDGFDTLSPNPILTPPSSSEPSENMNDSLSAAKLESVVESIPACNYCRNRRVKCSRTLPMCHACANSKKPCLYYDSILSKDISGSYIYTLYTNIKNMMNRGVICDMVLPSHTPAVLAVETAAGLPRNVFIPQGERIDISPLIGRSKDTFQWHGDNIFFGSSSPVAALDLAMAMRPGWVQPQGAPDEDIHPLTLSPEVTDHQLPQQKIILPPYPAAATLVHVFSRSINVFYPIMQQHALEKLLLTAYETPDTIHCTFEEQTLYIVLGIASQLMKCNDPSLVFTSSAYFKKGTSGDSIMHEKTSKSQVLLLQRSLLTCIYLLLDPGSGDLWRNLGFSIRLYFDMVHRPSDDEIERELAVMLYRALYCLER
ncbi:fungal-specific transcription factor domain-containing protein [Halenospora varia]|nr:fungal-specific transcription factor domain-containing protein [Halenospora varia]